MAAPNRVDGARSISGTRLHGSCLVRLTYLDDAGLFNKAQEPFIVIGAAVIDADKQLIAVEDHIESLVRKHIPEKDWDGFVFHATELWSGGKYFKREEWPKEKRLAILEDLAAIPKQFDIPITFGFQAREFMRPSFYPPHYTDRDRELQGHVDAFTRCCETVEHFMRECTEDEITLLIFEDRDSVRQLVKEAHALYRDPKRMKAFGHFLYFPFTKIRDTVHFAKKSESRHLQIADTCTFIIKKHLMKDPAIAPFYEALKPLLLVLPKGEPEWAPPS
jgi:hypothetical protein